MQRGLFGTADLEYGIVGAHAHQWGCNGLICPSCKDKRHKECQGSNWCDCQHRTEEGQVETVDIIDLNAADL